MAEVKFEIIKPNEIATLQLIADWYLSEWNIPKSKTIEHLKLLSVQHSQFQVLLKIDNIPVATGGLYDHVGLIDKEPRFSIYKKWLALVYTIPDKRHQGLGALLCDFIQRYSKDLGIKEIFLFTDTAESLYKRLGWKQLEQLSLGERNIVIMRKDL